MTDVKDKATIERQRENKRAICRCSSHVAHLNFTFPVIHDDGEVRANVGETSVLSTGLPESCHWSCH